jgi:subtilisin family serine protease
MLAALMGVTAAVTPAAPAPAAAGGDPLASLQWNMARVGAPAAWAASTGRGVVVAVVDTGIDLHHEDLPADRLVVLPQANFIAPGQPPQDDQGHGTHVAGIVGAEVGNNLGVESVAPGAQLMPVKVLGTNGRSSGNSVEDGIRFAADHGARVINVSIGAQLVQPVTGPGFESAIEYAWSKGAVPVVAAGNNYNGSLLGSGYSPQTHAIVVAATDRNDSPATYSSGSNGARWAIAAPGGSDPNVSPEKDTILSTYWVSGKANQYAWDAGTSMAAPHVAGAVADLLALGLTPQQAVDRVLATAKKGLDPSLGSGRLDVAAAVGRPSAAGAPGQTTPARPPIGPTSPAAGPAAGSGATTPVGGTAPAALAPSSTPTTAVVTPGGDAAQARPGSAAARPAGAPGQHRHRGLWPVVLLAVVLVTAFAAVIVGRALTRSPTGSASR